MKSPGQIILSGGPGLRNGREALVKWDRDYVADVDQAVVVQPADQTAEQFEQNVIEAFDSYNESARYDALSAPGNKNSNGLASGVLDAAGAGEAKPTSGTLIGFQPGWNDPVELPDATQDDTRPEEDEEK